MEGLPRPVNVVAARQILALGIHSLNHVTGGIALRRINVHRRSQETVFSFQRFRA